MIGGYAGRILRIDLSRQTISQEKLPPEEILRKYIGCNGLGLYYLFNELPNECESLDPESLLIFMTGPLTGTIALGGCNSTVVTLSHNTGYTAGRSHSHGQWGPNLKRAGYDGIIIKGKSQEPVYLWISDNTLEIRSAQGFWGMDTHQTEEEVKKDLKQPKASVATIGPAGENKCNGALIANDQNHSFSTSGAGTIMGSKMLKAIATFGTKQIEVNNRKKLEEIRRKTQKRFFESHAHDLIINAGIPKSEFRPLIDNSLCAAKNFNEVSPVEFGLGMSKHVIQPKACFSCPVFGSYDVKISSGLHQGYRATLGEGGEALEAVGALLGVYNSGDTFYLNDLCDRLGFDGSAIGCSIAFAIECYERGLITNQDTDGLELSWGNVEVIENLMNLVAHRQGFGKILADGAKKASYHIGGASSKYAVHIRGAAPNLHDWRAAWGVLLWQIVGNGSWSAPAADLHPTPEPDLGLNAPQTLSTDGKAQAVAITMKKKYWDDSIGVCWRGTWAYDGGLTYAAESVSTATGWDISPEEAILIGERIINLERIFNITRGYTPQNDFDISPRLLEPPPSGRAKGKTIAPYLQDMINEFYSLMGWEIKSEKPSLNTLQRIGLENFSGYLHSNN